MPMRKAANANPIYLQDRLLAQLKRVLEYPCTFVEAPMGYGKTTAVREYLKETAAQVLWQRVYDSSITGFWVAFCRLFRELDADIAGNLQRLGFPNDNVSMQEALELLNALPITKETVLVVDDYHLISGPETNSFFRFVITHEIEHFHIVLTARYAELMSVEELALKGYLYHITKSAFELMPQDIMRYYRMCGVDPKEDEVVRLYTVTEGWISALYLLMLSAKETGSFSDAKNIYKLVETAIYRQFSQTIQRFLLCLCLFDSFTLDQAIYMWGQANADTLLTEVCSKNAFVEYDSGTRTYQIHSIFTRFLREILEKEPASKIALYEKAGNWCLGAGEYFAAMRYFFAAGDFERLLHAAELDKGSSFGNEQKDLIIRYFESCPQETRRNHPIALLVYAMALMTYNETALFTDTCEELARIVQNGSLDEDSAHSLMGELELLLSFAHYNDIEGMSEHHQKACALMGGPSAFMDTTGNWTFGSPSVLYMFYRESGKLENEVRQIKEAMPYYYRLTNGHGAGAEHIMEAEWYFNKGDLDNAEIAVHHAHGQADGAHQPNIVACALFLQARLSLMKGEGISVPELSRQIHGEIERRESYELIHTVDICIGYLYSCLGQKEKVPEWLAQGNFSSSRLMFPARAFSNMIYGRVLLIRGEYLKLLGLSGQFDGIASVFPNVLPQIYTAIYVAAANERVCRRGEAIVAIKRALDMAMPDRMYVPFVENCDYVMPLLEEVCNQGVHQADILKILRLYKPYKKSMEQMKKAFSVQSRPKLSGREAEIARLAAEGFSNKEIGERLYISQNTVKTQLKKVFAKLDVSSRFLLAQLLKES